MTAASGSALEQPVEPDRQALRQRLARLLRGPVAKGASWIFVLQAAHGGLAFLTALVLARALGPAEFGAYAFAIAWSGLIALPASLGFGAYLVRQVAILQQGARWAELRGLLRAAILSVALASLAAAVAVWLLAWANPLGMEPLMAGALAVGAWLIPLGAILFALEGVLRGLHRVAQAYVANRLVLPAGFLLVVLGAHFWLDAELTGAVAVTLYLAAAGLALAAAAALLRRHRPRETATVTAVYASRNWLRDALPFTLLAGVQILQTNADIVMLGLLAEPEDTGVYRAASRTAGLMVFGLTAVNAAIAPRIAARHAAGQRRELQAGVTQAALAATAFALPAALLFLVAGEEILGLFGAAFRPGSGALAILTIGFLFTAAAGPNALILSMTGHANVAARGLALGAAVNVALNLALIPRYGGEGAAIAAAASMLLWNALLAWAVWRRLGIDSTVLGWRLRRKRTP